LTAENANSMIMPQLFSGPQTNTFLSDSPAAYRVWREHKLKCRQSLDPTMPVTLDRQQLFDQHGLRQARAHIAAFGFVLFDGASDLSKQGFLALNRQLGLNTIDANLSADSDAVTTLRVVDAQAKSSRYIPFTNRALNWHTDGYYNSPETMIRAFSLYCVQPAISGGETSLLDHEMVYLALRDMNYAWVEALMDAQVMTIPANVIDGETVRSEQSGPVFAIAEGVERTENEGAERSEKADRDNQAPQLTMRYTSRPGNIVWKAGASIQPALAAIRDLLDNNEYTVKLRLLAGQGVICRNILHRREAFDQNVAQSPRLFYRARYLDSLAGSLTDSVGSKV
jgi:hypothetical protein